MEVMEDATKYPDCNWRQTGGCDPNGPRESQFDKSCSMIIPDSASGYCECRGGTKQNEKGCESGNHKTCKEACQCM